MITPNEYITLGDGTEIIITNKDGNEKCRTKIDTRDIELVSGHRWATGKNGYAISNRWNGKRYIMAYLHHLILPKKEGFDVDHINRDRLDNRRLNLRYLSHQNNGYNNNAKGVIFMKGGNRKKRWLAYVGGPSTRKYLGYHDTFQEAKNIRDNYVRNIILK